LSAPCVVSGVWDVVAVSRENRAGYREGLVVFWRALRSSSRTRHGLGRICVQPRGVFLLTFFFQAEDGIRDATVTGVQTCALPISRNGDEAGAASTLPLSNRHRPLATSAAKQRAPDESTARKLPGKSSGCAANPCDENARSRDRPGTPRFVLMSSTPLAASVPYSAVAAGPGRIAMVAMRSTSMSSTREVVCPPTGTSSVAASSSARIPST